MSQSAFSPSYDYCHFYFNHPESKDRESVTLPYQKAEDFIVFLDEVRATGNVEMPGTGMTIKKSAITGYRKVKRPKDDQMSSEPTRYETNPPTLEQWQAIGRFVKDYFSWRCGTPLIFEATCKSIWNWDNELTKEALGS